MKILHVVIILFLLFINTKCNSQILKKKISDQEYRYEFYCIDKKPSIKPKRHYYWFKGGLIHSSESGIGGEVLDGAFSKYYLNNALAEQGELRKGLRFGNWKTWHQNGVLATEDKWRMGQRCGTFKKFDSNGKLIEIGKFNQNLRTGRWITNFPSDTLFYKKGILYKKKTSNRSLLNFFKSRKDTITTSKQVEAKNIKDSDRKNIKKNGDTSTESFTKKKHKKSTPKKSKKKKEIDTDSITKKASFWNKIFKNKKSSNAKSK